MRSDILLFTLRLLSNQLCGAIIVGANIHKRELMVGIRTKQAKICFIYHIYRAIVFTYNSN